MQEQATDRYLPTLQGLNDDGADGPAAGPSDLSAVDGQEENDGPDVGVVQIEEASGHAVQGGKKRKGENGGDGKVKKTRQSQSCDACRVRKVRCDRPPPGGTIDPSLPTKDVCSHCAHLELACTFQYKPRKRGPPNQYLRKMKEGASGIQNPGDNSGQSGFSPTSLWSPSELLRSGQTPRNAGEREYGMEPSHLDNIMSAIDFPHVQGWGDTTQASEAVRPNHPSSSVGEHATFSPSTRQANSHTLGPRHLQSNLQPHAHAMVPHTLNPASSGNHNSSRVSPRMVISPSTSSKSPMGTYPHNPQNPLDQVLPRGLLYLIIDLYFDYIYGLCPFVHRPSFMRDLYGRREEQPDSDEWVALVIGIVGSTVAQIPKAFVPLPRGEVKSLAIESLRIVHAFLSQPYNVVTVTRLTLLYIAGLLSWLTGSQPISFEYFGRCWALMNLDQANEESSYANYNPIDRELRRRVFWLMMGGDKSKAVLMGRCPIASDALYTNVALPSLIEDEFFDEQGYQSQPEDKTSILSGFYYSSKLFRFTGQMLDMQLADSTNRPTGLMLQMRIVEVNELYNEVMTLMDDCPSELCLHSTEDARSSESIPDDWGILASQEIEALFTNPKSNHKVVKDAFLVQQANIYVTQQMTRYMLLQYRDDLILLQQEQLSAQIRGEPGPSSGLPGQKRQAPLGGVFSDEEKAQVAADLLVILQKIPITVIAVNSLSLVAKVRFVASTLLDALSMQSRSPAVSDTQPSSRVEKAQNYLWEFLRILSEIEAHYSMDDN